MLANITFKAYELHNPSIKKDNESLLFEFTLPFADTDKIDRITNAIELAYDISNPIAWTINIDHEYI
jgi:hypothetical protein